MILKMIAWALAGAALCAGSVAGATESLSEPELRAQLAASVWPEDVVRLSREYRARFGGAAYGAEATARAEQAQAASRVLANREVQLPRSSFSAAADVPALRPFVERASRGDAGAAAQIARAYREGSGVAVDAERQLGWLQYAALLGDAAANYELSLHFRRLAQMPQAARYQTRAVELGFVLPAELDPTRK